VGTPAGARRSAEAGWRREGQALVRELEFRDFSDAIAFLERVAEAVDDYRRRPDMCILNYNRVRLTISNPNHAGITTAELRLADKVNLVIDGQTPGHG
jgi:4a-hydroxytetrahydrobiopterin dehydratase